MPFAIDGLRSHFTMLLFLYEIPSCIRGRKGYTGAALLFILIPQNKYITTNLSMNWTFSSALSVLVIIIFLL